MNAEVRIDDSFLFAGMPGRVDVRAIILATEQVYRLEHGALRSRYRGRSITWPRQTAMYVARNCTAQSLPQIGAALGLDHTTILHGVRAVEKRLQKPWLTTGLRAEIAAIIDIAAPRQNHELAWSAIFRALDALGNALTLLNERIDPLGWSR